MPTVRNLFDSPIVYVIPNYQRTYVWNEEDQWEPLWLDVVGIAQSLNENSKPHFLGATVIKGKGVLVEEAKQYSVVDGQQRLTTIQLLLASVVDVFSRYDDLSELKNVAESLTTNWIGRAPSKSEPDKIKPLGKDFLSFTEVMRTSRDGGQTQGSTGAIRNCYRFFYEKVSNWIADAEDPERKKQAKGLLTAISDKLQVVAIHLEDFENEYAIFEALNARGASLSEWEKTKNSILFKAGDTLDIDQGELYERYLRGFDEQQWMEETGRGMGRRRRSDIFLDYWLESKLRRQIDTRRVFREFRTETEKGAVNLEAWCDELKRDGDYFLNWETIWEWDGDVERIFNSRRRVLGIGAIWPFLLALSRMDMTTEDRSRCLRVLDSFLWRRAIAGMSARNYGDVAIALLNELPAGQNGEMPYSNAIIEYLITREEESNSWPTDGRVRQAVIETPFYRHWPQYRVRVLLEAIERAMMRGKHAGNEVMTGGRPIEHIMPQTRDEENWPLPADTAEDAEEIREQHIHRLGNLTLVEHGLNSKLGNRPWIAKRHILNEEDNLYINKDLLNHVPADYWDEEQIRLRGERLAGYVIKIWPRGHDVTGEIERV